jgi:hypothetical protein
MQALFAAVELRVLSLEGAALQAAASSTAPSMKEGRFHIRKLIEAAPDARMSSERRDAATPQNMFRNSISLILNL